MPANHSEPMKSRIDIPEDEIELIDLLRVIWKWKYMILSGTLICVLAAGVISMRKTKNYRLTTILKLSPIRAVDITKENANDKKRSGNDYFYIESPQNIKYLVERGVLNSEIKEYLKNSDNTAIANIPDIKVAPQGAGNLLQISTDSAETKVGVKILNSLKNVLMKKYENKAKSIESNYAAFILETENEISTFETQRKLVEIDINKASQRTNELESEIKDLKIITDLMINQREPVFKENKNNEIAPELLYRNMIQQNMALTNIYKNYLFDLLSKIDRQKFELKKIALQIQTGRKKLKAVETEKKNFKYIEVLQPPDSSIHLAKSYTKLNILIGAIIGLSATLFLAFFLDYIFKALKKKKLASLPA